MDTNRIDRSFKRGYINFWAISGGIESGYQNRLLILLSVFTHIGLWHIPRMVFFAPAIAATFEFCNFIRIFFIGIRPPIGWAAKVGIPFLIALCPSLSILLGINVGSPKIDSAEMSKIAPQIN